MSSKVDAHHIPQNIRNTISARYKRITRAVNIAFWNEDDDTKHSFYVGSYGRGTAITTSDLDVLIELPSYEYGHFSSLNGNGQSRLLQAVKNAILSTYPSTSVKGDGQVVVVQFSDNIKFEILPAFRNEKYGYWDNTYKYPDSHMGGNWLTTNPKAEINAMKDKDSEYQSNHLLTTTCQHIRYIRDNYFSSYHLSGILIDSFVYKSIDNWHFLRDGELPTYNSTSYEKFLLEKYNSLSALSNPYILAPGSNMIVDTSQGWDVLGKVLNFMAN